MGDLDVGLNTVTLAQNAKRKRASPRDALVYVIGEGTSEVQKNIIARDLGFKV